jgi:hypothetical protein
VGDRHLKFYEPRDNLRWDGSADLASHGVGFLLWGLLDFVIDGHLDTVQQLDEAIEAWRTCCSTTAPRRRGAATLV